MKKFILLNYCGVIITLLIASTSCKKPVDECANDMQIIAPDSVVEGEQMIISVQNYPIPEPINTYFSWSMPDESNTYQQKDKITIEHAQFSNEGEYSFTRQKSHCPTIKISKYIKVVPKTCPCFDLIQSNTLVIIDPNSTGSNPVTRSITPQVSIGSESFNINLGPSLAGYYSEFKLFFHRSIPDQSCTFKLRSYELDYQDPTIVENNNIQAYVRLIPDYATYLDFSVDDSEQEVYLKKLNNQLIITLCDVEFKGHYGNDPLRISGKIVINL